MAIETFLIEEAEKLISEPEELEQWTKTVEELGLEGQKELMKPDKSPIPFQSMNKNMQAVYKTLCPVKHKVKTYKSSTIPVRVLSLIALAQKEGYFQEIEIWSAEDKPDPVAVGFTGSTWSNDGVFIIARWGEELTDFITLEKKAKEIFKQAVKNTISALNVDAVVDKFFSTANTQTVYLGRD